MRTRIRSLDGLMLVARRRRSVFVPSLWRSRNIAAAFVISMPAYLVHRYIKLGVYAYYPKRTKKEKK